MCVFVSRPMKLPLFLKKTVTKKWVVDFLRERDTFRNKIVEIVEDFDEKSHNNNGKPWKSSKILRVKPIFFIFFRCSSFLFIFLFLIFFIFSFFNVYQFSFHSFSSFSSFFFICLLSSFFSFSFLGCSKSVFGGSNCFKILVTFLSRKNHVFEPSQNVPLFDTSFPYFSLAFFLQKKVPFLFF